MAGTLTNLLEKLQATPAPTQSTSTTVIHTWWGDLPASFHDLDCAQPSYDEAQAVLAADRDGWFSRGTALGTVGPAVFASHINYGGKKGGFADIAQLARGDEVSVHRADGTSVVFVVDRVERASKKSFPTAEVYGPTTGPEIRLITCGGTFDASTRNYEDNVVVFGHVTRAYHG